MRAIGQHRRPVRGLTLLFKQVFSDKHLITPKQYATYNGILGLALLALAAIPLTRPEPGSLVSAAILGGSGLFASGGGLVMLLRRTPLPGLLAAHGVCVALVGLFLSIHSLAWSVHAPSLDRFRYAPGLTLILVMYGMLQLAAFGPVPRVHAGRLRLAGLLAGIACELAVAICLLVLALRA